MKQFNNFLTEGKSQLTLIDLPYKKSELAPVMSEATIDYHYGHLAKGYVERYNKGEGDPSFNEAGAYLHNIFFPQLQEPQKNNKPTGAVRDLIISKYHTFINFKEAFEKVAMKIQGSGWVYLALDGEIKTIKNHEKRKDIVVLVDWWEHAWALDYQADKKKYLNNIWSIINWNIVNIRLV